MSGAAASGQADGAAIERIFPDPVSDASDAQLLDWYAAEAPAGRPWVRFNFVASADGAATHNGLSGQLGDAADHRVFALLRRLADVIVVGAGTIRAEGYAGELVSEADRQWRVAHGKPAHPHFAIVSGSLDLDPAGELFAISPVRPLVVTTRLADPGRLAEFAGVADVLIAGERSVDVDAMLAELDARGHRQVLSEGGPHLLGSFEQAGRVDELCLTVSPLLVGGRNPRVAVTAMEFPLRHLTLAQVLRADSTLILRYTAAN